MAGHGAIQKTYAEVTLRYVALGDAILYIDLSFWIMKYGYSRQDYLLQFPEIWSAQAGDYSVSVSGLISQEAIRKPTRIPSLGHVETRRATATICRSTHVSLYHQSKAQRSLYALWPLRMSVRPATPLVYNKGFKNPRGGRW